MAARSGEQPQVDVGVVTWNTAELTPGALRCLLDTAQGCALRLLVHDNASTDGTPEQLALQVPEADVEVGVENIGFARGMNRLIARSTAPWFLALNSDAWPEPGAIAHLVAAARRHPEAAAGAPRLRGPDGAVEHSTHPFPSIGMALLDASGGRRWLPARRREALCLEGAWHHDRPRRIDWAVGAALLMRRDAVEEIGGFDERFFMYVEDVEWCWRARSMGWEIRFEPAAVIRHVGDASGSRRFGDARIALEAANLRAFTRDAFGPAGSAAYHGIQAFACASRATIARVRSRRDESTFWRTWSKAYLGLTPLPFVGDPGGRHGPVDPGTGESPSGPSQPSDPGDPGEPPTVSVVIPTHGRAGRLASLVAALEAQRLPKDELEVFFVDDASPDDTVEVLETLARQTSFRMQVLHHPERRGPAAARNLGWRAARAPVVAFTDDDCIPGPDWLRAGLAAHAGGSRVVVGRTAPPPDQAGRAAEPFSRVMQVDSARFFETCNVFYRTVDLDAVGGFDEAFRRPSGEDTHLALAVIERGIEPVFAGGALVYHDVRPGSFRDTLRETWRWVDLPLVFRGRRYARSGRAHHLVFWKPTHPPAILAATGLLVGLHYRPALLLVLPWVRHRLVRSPTCADPIRRVTTLPAAFVVDISEVAVMLRGSVRHRTLFL
ncbi:MAG: glycosyltransferase family 2 protein [Acidimicrobiales bacterium]